MAVVRGNDTLLLKGYGKADLELDVPTPDGAVYAIGSVTKQFTPAAILQLRDAGKLDLEADITTWLPDSRPRATASPCAACSITPPASGA